MSVLVSRGWAKCCVGSWLLLASACSGVGLEEDEDAVSVGSAEFASSSHHVNGERLFETAFRKTNGRSCATCHVRDDHTVLTPAHVAALLAENPADPLFNRIDA